MCVPNHMTGGRCPCESAAVAWAAPSASMTLPVRSAATPSTSVAEVTPKDRNEYAAAVEAAAMKAAGDKAIQAEGSYEESESESYKLHSNGFEGSRRGTQFWGWVDISCQGEGDKREAAGTLDHHWILA